MKKFFRNLLSGYLLILILLLIEAGVLLFIQYGLGDVIGKWIGEDGSENLLKLLVAFGYLLVRLFGFIIAVIIFFKIVNKPENPEFKIPWIVGMLLLPFFFSMMFLIFGRHKLRRKEKKIIKATDDAYKKEFHLTEAEKEDLGNAVGTFAYLNNVTNVGAHQHNQVTYYKRGEDFFPALIEELKKATELIFMEFFIISDGVYWKEIRQILIDKAEAGVEVRLIYDDMGCGGTIASRTPRVLRKHGVKCYKFHPFRPILSGFYNNRDHRKIVIIDHKIAFTGGMNLADEYGNVIKRFGYWKDSMVAIKGSAISNLIAVFLQNYDFACVK